MIEEKILQEALKSQRELSKKMRMTIKDPHKLCAQCMDEYVWQTPEGLMLCEECNREYCEEHKTPMG